MRGRQCPNVLFNFSSSVQEEKNQLSVTAKGQSSWMFCIYKKAPPRRWPVWTSTSAWKITQEAETSLSAFMCRVYFIIIYLLWLLLSCMWSIFHYLISASQKKKKVWWALHKRERLNTQLCSAQLRWHWTPAALFKSGSADSRVNRTWQLIMRKWMRWRRRYSSAVEG